LFIEKAVQEVSTVYPFEALFNFAVHDEDPKIEFPVSQAANSKTTRPSLFQMWPT